MLFFVCLFGICAAIVAIAPASKTASVFVGCFYFFFAIVVGMGLGTAAINITQGLL